MPRVRLASSRTGGEGGGGGSQALITPALMPTRSASNTPLPSVCLQLYKLVYDNPDIGLRLRDEHTKRSLSSQTLLTATSQSNLIKLIWEGKGKDKAQSGSSRGGVFSKVGNVIRRASKSPDSNV